jgi:hypothetical protein
MRRLGGLRKGGVLLQAAFYPMGESTAVDTIFRPRELPLSSDEAYPTLAFEGQPDHIYAERLGSPGQRLEHRPAHLQRRQGSDSSAASAV